MKLTGIVIVLCAVVAASAWKCAYMCNNKASVAVCGSVMKDSNDCRWFMSMCILRVCASEYELEPISHCDFRTKLKTTINDNLPVPPNNDNGRRQS